MRLEGPTTLRTRIVIGKVPSRHFVPGVEPIPAINSGSREKIFHCVHPKPTRSASAADCNVPPCRLLLLHARLPTELGWTKLAFEPLFPQIMRPRPRARVRATINDWQTGGLPCSKG